MIKSNSKKAIENIRTYIVDHASSDNYDGRPLDSFQDAARFVWDCFRTERGTPEQMRYFNGSYQDAFIDWCAGLPSCIDTCYYYNRSAVDDLGAILEESETEKSRFSEAEAEKQLSYLIFREITKQARKDGTFYY